LIQRRRLLRCIAAVFLAACLGFLPALADELPAIERLPAEALVIETGSGKSITFKTEIADTDAERARGMMYRQDMAEDEAMLFIWPAPHEAAMWMRNTYIPLDMLFIAPDGDVVHIHRNAVPHSLDVISANRNVLAVLEIKGGAAARLGLSAGDRVKHRFFGQPSSQ
jgi:uncharacterized membrane protein (UPF0127 family)